jgi:hypothetical protein
MSYIFLNICEKYVVYEVKILRNEHLKGVCGGPEGIRTPHPFAASEVL